MRENWQPRKLHELGFVGRGRSRHRPRNDPSLYGGPYPFIQTGEIRAADLYLTHFRQTYNEAGLAQSKLWSPGTLCITIAANIAESAILKIPACFPDSVVGFIPFADRADVRFIKYSIDMLKLDMQNISHGTTQDNLSLDKLLLFDIPTPPLPLQRVIAGILSAYDELVENNERRIANLEERARLLYEEWFVKFRFPGHEKVRLVESEVGLIPQGWEVRKLGDVCLITMGQSPSSEFYNQTGEGLPFHQGVTDFGSRFPTDRVYCTLEQSVAQAGDILLSVRAPVGRLNLSLKKIIIGRGLCAIRSKDESQRFVFQQLRQQFQEEDTIGNGAIFRAVTKGEVYGIKLAWPTPGVLRSFEDYLQPIFSLLEALSRKNAMLRQARDRLLPGLISGEIDVSDWVEEEEAEVVELPARREVSLRKVVETAGTYEPGEQKEAEWKSLWE